MNEEFYVLQEILEASVEKNGEQPLTNKWLLNIINMLEKQIDREDEFVWKTIEYSFSISIAQYNKLWYNRQLNAKVTI